MKKTQKLFILLLVCLSLFLIGCVQKRECDFCGEMGKCEERSLWEEKVLICEDCIDDLKGERKSSINDLFNIDEKEDWKDEEKELELLRKTYKKVDVFENIEITFDGINGQGSCNIINHSEDPFISQVSFGMDEEKSDASHGQLCNGDNVAIRAYCDDELSDEYKCVIKTTTKSFRVSDLPISITAKDLSSEFIEQIKQYAHEILIAHTEEEARYYGYNNIKYECTYFCDNEYRNNYYNPDNPKTKIAVIFSLDRTDYYNNDIVEAKYYVVTFSSSWGEMLLYSDGTYKVKSLGNEYDIDTEYGIVDGWGDTLNEVLKEVTPFFEDETYFTKIKID